MSEGIGWLPVGARAALEEEQDKASAAQAAELLALDPRARVLALLDRLGCVGAADAACPKLRPADLAQVLASFEGAETPAAEALAMRYPGLVEPRG